MHEQNGAENRPENPPPNSPETRPENRMPLLRRRLAGLAAFVALLSVLALFAVARPLAVLKAPRPTILFQDRRGAYLGEAGGGDETGFGYWPLEELPKRVAAAAIAVEDRHFWSHPGVDLGAIARALWQNLSNAERISGASTIAMQIARMQNPGDRTYLKKALEAATALFLTQRYSRETLLKHYLRIVPYGNQVHGIAHAARRYFDKPVEDLSWAEVAFLAAIPQAPTRMNPFAPSGRARAVKRARRILDLLRKDEAMGDQDYDLAGSQLASLSVSPRPRRPEAALHAIFALEEKFMDKSLERGGVVSTSIDLELQSLASEIVRISVNDWGDRGAGNASLAVIDRSTREVLAWVGSTGYFDNRRAGAIDYAKILRSPGSTLKPFIFGLALEQKAIAPATILDDIRRGPGGMENSDNRFLGPLLPRVALANSRNVPAAELLEMLGLEQVYSFLGRLGLHDGSKPAGHFGVGIAIGSMPVTLEALVRAYGALAGDGLLNDLVWYRGQPNKPPLRILSEETARLITLFLSDPMARLPTFPRAATLEYPFPVAVKTGTSSNCHDAWTVAYSEKYLVAAWVGHPDNRPMRSLGGATSAGAMVKKILLKLHKNQTDGLENAGFPPPRGYKPVLVCPLSGQKATPSCSGAVLEYFAPGDEPVDSCRVHSAMAVDSRNGLMATSRTPREFLEVRTFADLGPRYATWQAAQGLERPPEEASPLGAVGQASRWTIGKKGAIAEVKDKQPTIRIVSPASAAKVMIDPETPIQNATLALEAVVDPPVEQVVWYVDGNPFAVSDYPGVVRWPLTPGEHTFQARLPFSTVASYSVKATVF